MMTGRSPKISIIVPTFNRAEFLSECLDSLLGQSLPALQILVVNDGSTDRTRQALEPYQGRIDYLETDQLGKSGALNSGLKKVTGDYLWIFDDDDVALSDALERFVVPLEAERCYDFSFSTFYFSATQPKSHRIGRVLSELKIPNLQERGFLAPLLERNFLGGAALFARTSCYREVGEFDASLLRSQDYQMAIRIARQFKGVRVQGGATFHYRQHRGNRGNRRDRFASKLQLKKWLEYDHLFFRSLYRSLELAEYLPIGLDPVKNRRQAFLQRLAIMANKQLLPEVVQDLDNLVQLADDRPFFATEKMILQVMVSAGYHKRSNLLNHREFPRIIRRLSASSKVIALLRSEIYLAIDARFREKKNLWRFLEWVLRSYYLHVP